MIYPPKGEKPTTPRPASDGLFFHVIDEMPLRVVCAVTFVMFFFVWGGVNNVIKLFRKDLAMLSVDYGFWAGALAAIATPIVIYSLKRRAK